MECRKCQKKYHYCSSCDYSFPENIGFCSYECWESSDEYIGRINRFENIIKDLSNRQLIDLLNLIEQEGFGDYGGAFTGILMERLK